MNVAQEVHVGGAAVQPFVLHQELTEQHLRFVSLSHDLQLHGVGPPLQQLTDDGSDPLGQRVVQLWQGEHVSLL